VDKLDYVEAQDDYVCLHSEGRRFLKEQTMGNSRRCWIFAIRADSTGRTSSTSSGLPGSSWYAKDSRIAILQTGTKLPVSRSGYARLSELL